MSTSPNNGEAHPGGNRSDLDPGSFADANEAALIELSTLTDDFIEKHIGDVKRERTLELGLSIQVESDTDEPASVFANPNNVNIIEQEDNVKVIVFATMQTPAAVSLTIPKNGGSPSFEIGYSELADQILRPEISSSLKAHAAVEPHGCGVLFEQLYKINERIRMTKNSGVQLHEEYTGPEFSQNQDGTVTVPGEQLEEFIAGMPSEDLDGILASTEEVDVIIAAVQVMLDEAPGAVVTKSGHRSEAFDDDTSCTMSYLDVQSGIPEITQFYANAGLAGREITYRTKTHAMSIRYAVGSDEPQIKIIDLETRKAAVTQKLASGGIATSKTITDGALSFTVNGSADSALFEVISEESKHASAPSQGKVNTVKSMLVELEEKLEQLAH
jgi:hypothetical protein